MAAGAEVVYNDVVRKVEIEEKCVASLDLSDLKEHGAVATVNGNSIKVSAGDPGDTGDVNVDDIALKSDSVDEIDQFKKEESELGGETKGDDDDVEAVKDNVNLETNDIAEDVNGHFGKITGEKGAVVKSTEEVKDANVITNGEAKTDAINTTDELSSTLSPVMNTDCEVMENDGSESIRTLIDNVNPKAVIEFGSFGRHDDVISVPDVINGDTKPVCDADSDNLEQNVESSHGDGDSDKMSCLEGSVSDDIDVHNEEDEVPSFEDENFNDQITSAQLLVEEKTRLRDEIRDEIQGKRENLKAYYKTYNEAKLEETTARQLVRLKRQEIESVKIVINRFKNAMSVEDIDTRISNMEYVIQHETLHLNVEKQFIHEINLLTGFRDLLASNMGTEEEIRQAIDQKDQNEERMEILKKELDSLKEKVSKAEAVIKGVAKKFDEESRKERELQAQFRVANDVCQKVDAHLNNLKKLSYDKNKNFHLYKEDLMAARNIASCGDKDALHRLCANQVESFMEQWNNNNDFRKENVSRCNIGSLVHDDVAPVLPVNMNGKVDKNPVPVPVPDDVAPVVPRNVNEKAENVTGQKNQTLKTETLTKLISGNDDVAIKLKEQRRLEEKAKAIEALERKKRNADKAQVRAELRARKEAEQKEKEKEKRLRKKEKSHDEAPTNSHTETVNKNTTKKTPKPPPHFFLKHLKPKPVPPPLANRNKKRWQQWGQMAIAAVVIVALFLVGNDGFFNNLKVSKSNGHI